MDLLYRREGMPSEGELVMCEVTNVYNNGVFVKLIEYDKQGFIHISEVSPGRIRNLNDFVRVGKVIICKVLRVDKEKGHIDLSLRRVNESQRRMKSEEIKQEQKAEKIIELAAKDLHMKKEELYNIVSEKLLARHPYIYIGFSEYLTDNNFLDKYHFDERIKNKLLELISSRIKPPVAELAGEITLTSYAPNGVELIRSAFKKGFEKFSDIEVKYEGSGKFLMRTKSIDYKKATDKLTGFAETIINFLKSSDKESIVNYTIREV